MNDQQPGQGGAKLGLPLLCLAYLAVGVGLGAVWWQFSETRVVNAFHKLYYRHASRTLHNTYWLGVPTRKCPLDMWVYGEILYETRPDVIVETGTYKGGSAYFFASMFDLMDQGRVLTIDIADQPDKPKHKRISYLLGSSTSDSVFQAVKNSVKESEKVMVVLDSDHTKAHVLNELRLYSALVTVGSYLVVEDTDLNGHPVSPEHGPGPAEALEEFLETNSDFVRDASREKFGLTFFPGGWLKRIR